MMGTVVDMAEHVRGKHRPTMRRHPSGALTASGVPMVRVCGTCGTLWPCAAARKLNLNEN